MTMFTMVAMTYNACILIILRAHYSIDIISGFVYGHYLWIIANKYLTINIYKTSKIDVA